MDPQASSLQRQPNAQDSTKLTIQWERDHTLTTILVNHLTTHPSDRCILFYSDGKKAMPAVEDAPSGKDKNEIHNVITRLIFTTHPKYKSTYYQDLKKFHSLKNKYKKCKAKFNATGAGVVPLDTTTSQNLLDDVNTELPWYTDIDSIWHSIPSFAIKSHSSRPGVDHAGNLYFLVQPHGDPCGGIAQAGAPPPLPPHATSAQSHGAYPQPQPSHNAFPPQPQPHSTFSPQLQSSNSTQPPCLMPSPNAAAGGGGMQNFDDSHIDPCLWQPTPSAPHNDMDTDHHMHDPDDDDDDIYLSGPLSAPLWDALHHLEDDSMGPNSPTRAAGKKHQLTKSPSPPDPPNPFEPLQKSPTSFYDSCVAFGVQQPSSHGGQHRQASSISLGMSCSMSTASSTTHNMSSSSDFMSPTPQTSLQTSVGGSRKKKAKSDIQEQVDKVTDEIETIQSNTALHHDSKHQRFLAKLDTKTDHHHDVRKYKWLCDTRAHESSQAAVSHQRLQESKDADIRLHNVDIRVHKAHSLILDKEAETLRLKIQFHQMMQGIKPPASDGE